MRQIKPCKTMRGLQKTLDNGGRFYNFFTDADDNVVSRSELAKAAGVFSNELNAFLFLEMAQQELSGADRTSIEVLLETDLRERYRELRPATLRPSQVESRGVAGKAVIVTGYPRFVENRTEFEYFIMIPIQNSGFVMMPIFDQYDVYEVFDDRRMRKSNSMIATVRGKKLNSDGLIRFGGVLRKLEFADETKKSHKFYLEAAYYTRL